ncbi:MAG: hypothetical protein ACF8OB_06970, partial [Phycisphaeraceae bacterium JB051]
KGKMRFVGSSDKPNAKFDGYRIVAIKRIRKEDVITVGVERASKVTGRKTRTTEQTLQKAA